MCPARTLPTSPRAATPGDKRKAIMRAATRVFARNGYFNSKVADVAREAGVADGTIYLYFKSKEEILRSIFEHNMAEAVATGREELSKIEDPREKLQRIAHHHLERLGADRDLAIVFQVELRASTKFMEELSAAGLAEYLSLIREVFEEGQRAGVFRKELNANLVSKVLFGALDEMATNWILSRRRYKLAPMADQVLNIFLSGITTNVIVSGEEHSSYTRKVARILIMVDYALETLLMLADEGPLTIESLGKELVPKENIIKVISELRQCELVESSGNMLSLTPQATKIVASLRMKLEANPNERS